MENILSMQDLKRTGLSKIRQMFTNEPDIIIQDRGHDACVLVELEHYNFLRNCELEIALIKAREDIKEGNYITGAENHINKMNKILKTSVV
jgi:hypothetical protein